MSFINVVDPPTGFHHSLITPQKPSLALASIGKAVVPQWAPAPPAGDRQRQPLGTTS